MVARDTVVAARLSAAVRDAGQRAIVVAGDHEYGRQLDAQLRLAALPRVDDADHADLVVLAGLADQPETARAADLSSLPVIAFDGVQGAPLGAGRSVRLALPLAPRDGVALEDLLAGTEGARNAADLVVTALRSGVADRAALLAELRVRGHFDDHGDPIDPPVWLWRVGDDWTPEPDRAI